MKIASHVIAALLFITSYVHGSIASANPYPKVIAQFSELKQSTGEVRRYTIYENGQISLEFPMTIGGKSIPMSGMFTQLLAPQKLRAIFVETVLLAQASLASPGVTPNCKSNPVEVFAVINDGRPTAVAVLTECSSQLPADPQLRNAALNLVRDFKAAIALVQDAAPAETQASSEVLCGRLAFLAVQPVCAPKIHCPAVATLPSAQLVLKNGHKVRLENDEVVGNRYGEEICVQGNWSSSSTFRAEVLSKGSL